MKKEQANLTYAILKLVKEKETNLISKVLELKLKRKPTGRELAQVSRKPNENNTIDIYFKSKKLGKITYEMKDKELSLCYE